MAATPKGQQNKRVSAEWKRLLCKDTSSDTSDALPAAEETYNHGGPPTRSLTFWAPLLPPSLVESPDQSATPSLASTSSPSSRVTDALQLLQWTIQPPIGQIWLLPPRQLHKTCCLAGMGESFFLLADRGAACTALRSAATPDAYT